MKKITIITPWYGHHELITDYEESVAGAHVITIDNGSDPTSGQLIQKMTERLGGIYIRNQTNLGFAAANNQGLARANGEIIMFLNNDIKAKSGWLSKVAEDVEPESICGPSFKVKMVYGYNWPYLEGWCIAAYADLWKRIEGWDAKAYTGPYWEDCDICFRAMALGFSLIKIEWSIEHKGGATIGAAMIHGESYERNRAVFASRVRPYWARTVLEDKKNLSFAQRIYLEELAKHSEIREHLSFLYSSSHGRVLEIGETNYIITAALLAGIDTNGGKLWTIGNITNNFKCLERSNWVYISDINKLSESNIPSDLNFILYKPNDSNLLNTLEILSKRIAPKGKICIFTKKYSAFIEAVCNFSREIGWEPPKFVLGGGGLIILEPRGV